MNTNSKLSKKERKKMYEEYLDIQKKKLFESKEIDFSVSSWDFVYYVSKYKQQN
jgi:Zn-dependent oligopeptidase